MYRIPGIAGAALRSFTGTPNPLPASFLRGGTSKGVFINRAHLPAEQAQWDRILLGLMGSPDAQYGRQLNGMGGGISSLSKVCVVGPPPSSAAREVDVEYTFVQVGIRDEQLDYSGNCGNLSSMIGVFAVDQGLCAPRVKGGLGTVRSLNTNTNKIIETTFPVSSNHELGHVPELALEQVSIAGVPGLASQIILDFVNPAGARTGVLLPTGNPTDTIVLEGGKTIRASLVDAANPTVLITDVDLRAVLGQSGSDALKLEDASVLEVLEEIRQAGAARMGLDPSAQAQPKIAVMSAPTSGEEEGAHLVVRALSMGVPHKAIPISVALCIGVAARTPGTLVAELVAGADAGGKLFRIRHPGGVVDVGADVAEDGEVHSAKVMRTGKRLMEGAVWW
ncbi:DUF453-domain-containing protein [Peniophora sp. CONT]|nr:DUF453-domain-containing protein [Peniophora sp. CONT]